MDLRYPPSPFDIPRITIRRLLSCFLIFCLAFLVAAISGGGNIGAHVSAGTVETPADEGMTIVDFLDVGQGSSTLIRFPDGKVMLIDTGPKSARDSLLSSLSARAIDKIDCFILTHQHGDHTDNAIDILDFYSVDDLIMPDSPPSLFLNIPKYEKLYNDIEERGYSIRNPQKGEIVLSGDDYLVTVLSDDTGTYQQLNDYSIVLQVTTGEVSFLLMADSEAFVEQQLIQNGDSLSADVLQVGHHGNFAGSTQEFLEKVHPRISVISVGKNPFGQPFDAVINRLDREGSSVLSTDLYDTITVTTDGERIYLDYGEI